MAKRRRPKKQSDMWVEDIQQDIKNDAKSVENFVPATVQGLTDEISEWVEHILIYSQDEVEELVNTYTKNETSYIGVYDMLPDDDPMQQNITRWITITSEPLTTERLIELLQIIWWLWSDRERMRIYLSALSHAQTIHSSRQDVLILRNKWVYELPMFPLNSDMERVQELWSELQDLILSEWCTDKTFGHVLDWIYALWYDPRIDKVSSKPVWFAGDIFWLESFEVGHILAWLVSLPRDGAQREQLLAIQRWFPDPVLLTLLRSAKLGKKLSETEEVMMRMKVSIAILLFTNHADQRAKYDYTMAYFTKTIKNSTNPRETINLLNESLSSTAFSGNEHLEGLIETISQMKYIYDQYNKETLLIDRVSGSKQVNFVNWLLKAPFRDVKRHEELKEKVVLLNKFWWNMKNELKRGRSFEQCVLLSKPKADIYVYWTVDYSWQEAMRSWNPSIGAMYSEKSKEIDHLFSWFDELKEELNTRFLKGIDWSEGNQYIIDLNQGEFPHIASIVEKMFDILPYVFVKSYLLLRWQEDVKRNYWNILSRILEHLNEMPKDIFLEKWWEDFLSWPIGSTEMKIDVKNSFLTSESLTEYIQHMRWATWTTKYVVIILHYMYLELAALDMEHVLDIWYVFIKPLLENPVLHLESSDKMSYFDIACQLWSEHFAKKMLDKWIDRTKTTERLKSDFTEKKLKFLDNFVIKKTPVLWEETFVLMDISDQDKTYKLNPPQWIQRIKEKRSQEKIEKKREKRLEQLHSEYKFVDLYDIDWQSIVHHMVDDESMSEQDLERYIKWLGDDFDFSTTNSEWLTLLIYALAGKKFKKAKFLLDFFLFKIHVVAIANELNGKSIVHYISHFTSDQIKVLLDLITKIPQFRARFMGYKHLFEISNFWKLLQHKNPETKLTWLQTLAEYGHIELVEELIEQYELDIWWESKPKDVLDLIAGSKNISVEVYKRFESQYAETLDLWSVSYRGLNDLTIQKAWLPTGDYLTRWDNNIYAQERSFRVYHIQGWQYYTISWKKNDEGEVIYDQHKKLTSCMIPNQQYIDAVKNNSMARSWGIAEPTLHQSNQHIIAAIRSWNPDLVRYILSQWRFDPDAVYEFGYTASDMEAALYQYKKMIDDDELWTHKAKEIIILLRNADQAYKSWYKKHLESKHLDQIQTILSQSS